MMLESVLVECDSFKLHLDLGKDCLFFWYFFSEWLSHFILELCVYF